MKRWTQLVLAAVVTAGGCSPDEKGNTPPIESADGTAGDDDDDVTGSGGSGADTTTGGGEDLCGELYTCALTVEPVYCRQPGDTPCYTWDELVKTYRDNGYDNLPEVNRRCLGATVVGAYHVPAEYCLEETDPTPSCVDICNALPFSDDADPDTFDWDFPDPWVAPDEVVWSATSRNCRTQAASQDDNYAQENCGSAQPAANGYLDGYCGEFQCNPPGDDDDDDDDICDPALVYWHSNGRCVWLYGEPGEKDTDWFVGDATALLMSGANLDWRRFMCVGPADNPDTFDTQAELLCSPAGMPPDDVDLVLSMEDLEGGLLGQDFNLKEEWDHDDDPLTPDLEGFAYCANWGLSQDHGEYFDDGYGNCNDNCGTAGQTCTETDYQDRTVETEDPCDLDECSTIEDECLRVDHDNNPSTPDIGYADSGATYTRSGYTFYAHLDVEWVDGFVRPNVLRLWACDGGKYVVGGPGDIHDFQNLTVDSVPYDLGFRNGDHYVRVQATTGSPNYTPTGDQYYIHNQTEIYRALDNIVPSSGAFDVVFTVNTTAGTVKTIHVEVD